MVNWLEINEGGFMEDFKKELAILLETHGMAIISRTVVYGENKDKYCSQVGFQESVGVSPETFMTGRTHVTGYELDHTLEQSPMGKKIEGLS